MFGLGTVDLDCEIGGSSCRGCAFAVESVDLIAAAFASVDMEVVGGVEAHLSPAETGNFNVGELAHCGEACLIPFYREEADGVVHRSGEQRAIFRDGDTGGSAFQDLFHTGVHDLLTVVAYVDKRRCCGLFTVGANL